MDLVSNGKTGWVLPIRDPNAFIEKLTWCQTNRTELAEMVNKMYHTFESRDWSDVAADIEKMLHLEIT